MPNGTEAMLRCLCRGIPYLSKDETAFFNPWSAKCNVCGEEVRGYNAGNAAMKWNRKQVS